MRTHNLKRIQAALKIGTLPLAFKKRRGNWCAVVPSKIGPGGEILELSSVTLFDWPRQGLKRLRFDATSRYLAQVYPDSMICYVNLRWALKLPNWTGRFGAMGELSEAMHRAGLIP